MTALPFSTNLEAEVREEARRRESGDDRTLTMAEHRDLLDQAVAEANEKGLQEGYAKGDADARETILAKCSTSIAAVAPQMEAILERSSEHRAHLERQLIAFAYAVAEKVAPDVLRLRAKASVLESIRETLALTLAQPKLVVSVSPAVREAMGSDLEAVAEQLGHKGSLQVSEDPEMTDGEARVSWDDGFMDYSFDRVCEQILDTLGGAAKNASPST